MAPTPTQEEGGEEGSGARELRRFTRARAARSQPAATTPPRVGRSEPPTSSQSRRTRPAVAKEPLKRSKAAGKSRVAPRTTRKPLGQGTDVAASASASSASAALKQHMEERSGASQEPPKKRKTVMAEKGSVAEENAPRRSKRRRMGDPEAAAVAPASSSSSAAAVLPTFSSASSPLRQPTFEHGAENLEAYNKIDPAIFDAYDKLDDAYTEKLARHQKLITLELVPHSYLENPGSYMENPGYGPTYDSGVETVLKTAKFVFGLSSHIGGKLLNHASGFVIEWDKERKIATVITSSLLICTNPPSMDEWLGKDEFAPHAEVSVHLLKKDDTTAPAKLIHCDKHYDFALYKVEMDLVSEIPSFSTEVKYGQDIFVLGRDKYQNLMTNNGNVVHYGPNGFNRHHHMFASCTLNEYYHGGPVIELNGQVLGMITRPARKFIPSVLILDCLRMLKKFDCIPRLHTGMKFSAISFLYPVQREKISRKCDIHVGLIVTEVSKESIAEKIGIRRGDVVESWNGEAVATTFELETFLLRLCEEHLDTGNDIGSDVEISIGVYRVRKDSRRTVNITLKICNDVEVVARDVYDVATTISAAVSPDDQNSGNEERCGSGEDEVGRC